MGIYRLFSRSKYDSPSCVSIILTRNFRDLNNAIYNTLAKSNALIIPYCMTKLHILVSDLCEQETNRCYRSERHGHPCSHF